MFEELRTLLEGDIATDEETLVQYSHDASLFEIKPSVVVFAKNSSDIQKLVKWVNEKKPTHPELSITIRAAGTCMSGGPLNDSIIVDTTKYMNQVLSVSRVPQYIIQPKFPGSNPIVVTGEARVMPGCYYRDFEPKTLEQGLLLPCYTASKSLNAVGGMVGNNSAGELTLRYGKTEDYVKELKVILADGHEYVMRPLTRRELYQKISEQTLEGKVYKKLFNLIQENEETIRKAKPNVSKNSAGYMLWHVLTRGKTEDEDVFDLSQIIIGAQGTLGIVTEITFRLVEKQKKSKLMVMFLPNLEKLGLVVDELLETDPISIESYDDKTFKLAIRFFGDLLKQKGFFSMLRFSLSFTPEFFMVLFGGVPKLMLLAEYAGVDENEIQKKCIQAQKKVSHFGYRIRITRNEREAEKYWTMRRDSFALLRKHVQGKRTAPFIDDIIVRPEHLPEFLPKLNALIAEYPMLIYTIAGHAANGNFHIIPLIDVTEEHIPDIVISLSKKVYDLVLSYGGSIDAEHNDGIIRTPFLPQMYGEVVCGLFDHTKQIFDEKKIFNPHKKVGVTFDDIKKYIVKPSAPLRHHAS